MKRWLPFLLFGLVLIGMGLVLSDYASDQADRIVDSPSVKASAEPDDTQSVACARAQARYDELWDQSLENPDDAEKEEELGVGLGELYQACGTGPAVGADEADEMEDSGSETEPN